MRGNAGFTLIELILVTVIIGILAGMVAVNYGGYTRKAQINAAKGDIMSYSQAVDLYALEHNDTYPKTLEDLVSGERKYVKEIKLDPWKNPYVYKPGTDAAKADYEIFSCGPDGAPGTEDDVTASSDASGGAAPRSGA